MPAGLAASLLLALSLTGPATDTNWLFLLDAESVKTDGYTMTLDGVDIETLAFSDHPQRLAHHMGTSDFVGLWSKADFSGDPPNAGVTATVDGKLVNAVVELTDPVLTGDTLTFDIKVLEGTIPEGGTDVMLFVDAFPTAINSQITDS